MCVYNWRKIRVFMGGISHLFIGTRGHIFSLRLEQEQGKAKTTVSIEGSCPLNLFSLRTSIILAIYAFLIVYSSNAFFFQNLKIILKIFCSN